MIAVLDYGIGNVGSILNMLRKIGVPAVAASTPEQLRAGDKLILPGVGAFDKGMNRLGSTGLLQVLHDLVMEERRPVLGICLGLQLFTRGSEEGSTRGLGWLPADTVRFRGQAGLRIPHMGWNAVRIGAENALVDDMTEAPRFYFVHSYHLACDAPGDVLGTAHHGYEFPAIVVRGNIAGTQFHPEKSHRFGMALLRNFATRF